MRARTHKDPAAQAVDAVRAGGKPLPAHVRLQAAEQYGFGFDHVRVHDEQPAHGAAHTLHAAAYTIGADIGFAEGRYDPGSASGAALLQHELRHVAQQHWAAAARSPQVDPGDSVHERDAREPFAAQVPALSEQRIQCAPEEEQYSLGGGLIDTIGRKATSDASWPFIKAVLEGFVGGLKSDVKAGRADAAKSHLSELMRPWNAARFYGGYVVGLVIGLVSPVTDLVKGAIGLFKIGAAGLGWLAKWSPVGVAISAERQRKIAQLSLKLDDLMGDLGTSLMDFVTDPKGASQKFSGFLDSLMQMALSKARGIGAGAAHALFDFLGKEFYEMGKGIGEVIGMMIAQALMLAFSNAIGGLVTKGASFVGKAAEFVAGKAVELFGWLKGIFVEGAALLRDAVKGALKVFQGVVNKAVEAFDALVALFSDAAAADLAGERVAAGVGKVAPGELSNVMESRMVVSGRTSPATVADLKPPKIHPSNVGKEASVSKAVAEPPKAGPVNAGNEAGVSKSVAEPPKAGSAAAEAELGKPAPQRSLFRLGSKFVDESGELTSEGVRVLRNSKQFQNEFLGATEQQVKNAFARDITIGRRGKYLEVLTTHEAELAHIASKDAFVVSNKNLRSILTELEERAPGSVRSTDVLEKNAADFAHGDEVLKAEIAKLDQHPNPVVRDMWKNWYGNEFKNSTIGGKRPDLVEFLPSRNLAVVSDPTLAVSSEFGPIHAFKTLFYRRVLEVSTGLEVGSMDIGPGLVRLIGD